MLLLICLNYLVFFCATKKVHEIGELKNLQD